APHLLVDGLAVESQLPVEVDGCHGEVAGRACRVVLEDETWRMRGRANGPEQGPLVDDQDLFPAQPSEVVGRGAAYDAGPDDDDLCTFGQLFRRSHARSAPGASP